MTIRLGGTIKSYISVKPGPRVIFSGYAGDKPEEKLTIAALADEPLGITGVSSNIDDKIEYELQNEKQGKEYSLLVRPRGGLEEPFRGRIVLKTTSQKKPEVMITVVATLRKLMQISPEYVYFGIIDSGKGNPDESSLKRASVISHVKSEDFTVKKIETSKDFILAEADTGRTGKQHTISLSLDRNKLPTGKFRETVSIHTQCRGKLDTAIIIVEGKVI